MSYSLQVANGDFTVAAAQLGTVVDVAKLTQDLTCCLLEPMGTDDMHLDYGSLLDGGTLPDGTVSPGVIGVSDINRVAALVRTEIARVTANYQSQQLARAKADQAVYNRASLSSAEVLISVTDVSLTQVEDALNVVITLQTGQGSSLSVAVSMLTGT